MGLFGKKDQAKEYTDEKAGYMVNDETGERFKIKKSTKRARKLFSVVSD